MGTTALLLTAFARGASAQTFSGNIIGIGDGQRTSTVVTANGTAATLTADSLGTPVGQTLGLNLSFSPSGPYNFNLTYNSLAVKLTAPAILSQNNYTTGLNQVTSITTSIQFNPLNFNLNIPTNTGSMVPQSGYPQPTYSLPDLVQSILTTVDLTGTYSVSDASGTQTGTFSVPLTVDLSLSGLLQTTNYPTSVSAYEMVSTSFTSSTPLFSVDLGGINVTAGSVDFTQDDYGGKLTDADPVPEPSAWALLGLGMVALVFWRDRARRG